MHTAHRRSHFLRVAVWLAHGAARDESELPALFWPSFPHVRSLIPLTSTLPTGSHTLTDAHHGCTTLHCDQRLHRYGFRYMRPDIVVSASSCSSYYCHPSHLRHRSRRRRADLCQGRRYLRAKQGRRAQVAGCLQGQGELGDCGGLLLLRYILHPFEIIRTTHARVIGRMVR